MASGYLVRIDTTGEVKRIRIENKVGPDIADIDGAVGGTAGRVWVIYEGQKRLAYLNENANLLLRKPPVNPTASRMVQQAHMQAQTVEILGPIVVWIPDKAGSRLRKREPVIKKEEEGEREIFMDPEREELEGTKSVLAEERHKTRGGPTPGAPGSDDV